MNSAIAARSWQLLLGTCTVAAVFAVVVGGIGLVLPAMALTMALPFVAAGLSAVAVAAVVPWTNRVSQRTTDTDPGAALAEATAGFRAGSLEHVLAGLAQVIAEGTRARRATVWLAIVDKLVRAACFPVDTETEARSTANLAALLAQPDVDHAVPVLDGSVLRAALTVEKPGRPVTPADQRLMRDIAQGAGLLLHGAQLASQLEKRVRRADELATQRQASRQRLTRAREVERQRLVGELTQVITSRLAALRRDIAEVQDLLSGAEPDAERTQQTLARARTGLDELLEKFRVIARGVYPAVLRGQGPAGALEELAADLPRPVRLSGRPTRRLSWEVESGIYWLAASAMQQLAGQPAEAPLRVHLEHTAARLAVRIDDSALAMPADQVRAALIDDVDRLTALGGDVQIAEDGAGGIALRAWLPDQLEPSIERTIRQRNVPGAS